MLRYSPVFTKGKQHTGNTGRRQRILKQQQCLVVGTITPPTSTKLWDTRTQFRTQLNWKGCAKLLSRSKNYKKGAVVAFSLLATTFALTTYPIVANGTSISENKQETENISYYGDSLAKGTTNAWDTWYDLWEEGRTKRRTIPTECYKGGVADQQQQIAREKGKNINIDCTNTQDGLKVKGFDNNVHAMSSSKDKKKHVIFMLNNDLLTLWREKLEPLFAAGNAAPQQQIIKQKLRDLEPELQSLVQVFESAIRVFDGKVGPDSTIVLIKPYNIYQPVNYRYETAKDIVSKVGKRVDRVAMTMNTQGKNTYLTVDTETIAEKPGNISADNLHLSEAGARDVAKEIERKIAATSIPTSTLAPTSSGHNPASVPSP